MIGLVEKHNPLRHHLDLDFEYDPAREGVLEKLGTTKEEVEKVVMEFIQKGPETFTGLLLRMLSEGKIPGGILVCFAITGIKAIGQELVSQQIYGKEYDQDRDQGV